MEQALELAEKAAYTEGEMEAYDKYWDFVSNEKTMLSDKLEEGVAIGVAKGRQEGIQEGRKEGIQEGRKEGLQEGIQLGRQQLVQEMLENLVANGMTMEEARRALRVG